MVRKSRPLLFDAKAIARSTSTQVNSEGLDVAAEEYNGKSVYKAFYPNKKQNALAQTGPRAKKGWPHRPWIRLPSAFLALFDPSDDEPHYEGSKPCVYGVIEEP